MTRFTIKEIILYAAGICLLTLILQLMQYKLLLLTHAMEFYIFGIALIFTLLGIWLARKLSRDKVIRETVLVEKEVMVYKPADAFTADRALIRKLNLSERELEGLELMRAGASNQQIADRLFLSLHTVKTHAARLFEKLDVQRRTQAVDKARQLRIIE